MIKRKSVIEQPKKKDEILGDPVIKVKRGTDMSLLQPAIVEGKFVVPVDGKVIAERFRGGKITLVYCSVRTIEENVIHLWDETNQQWFLINLEQAPDVRIA